MRRARSPGARSGRQQREHALMRQVRGGMGDRMRRRTPEESPDLAVDGAADEVLVVDGVEVQRGHKVGVPARTCQAYALHSISMNSIKVPCAHLHDLKPRLLWELPVARSGKGGAEPGQKTGV